MFEYINIIGYGYVGGSMGFLCKNRDIKFGIVDTQAKVNVGEEIYFSDLLDAIKESEKSNEVNFYFICVPTPSKKGLYTCDTSIVKSVFDILSKNCTKKTIVIIKSTLVPGTSRSLHDGVNKNISLFFCPEFLTEKNAENDVINETKIIVGGFDESRNIDMFNLMSMLYTKNNISFCTYEYAEMMKYTINCYLAQKVAFFNDIHESCEKLGLNYDNLKELVLLDRRISPSHTSVPGPDGKFGFGGSCFIKEMKGMIDFRKKNLLQCEHLVNILDLNTKRRGKGDSIMDIVYSVFGRYISIPGDILNINMEEDHDSFIEKNKWSFYFDKLERLYRIERNSVIYELYSVEKESDEYHAVLTLKDSECNSIDLRLIKNKLNKFYIDMISSLGFTSNTLNY